MLTPQEIETKYIIPAIRKELALALIELGLNASESAKLIGVSKSAVSQYQSGVRGKDVDLCLDIKDKIKKCAKKIKNGSDALVELQQLIKFMEAKGHVCKVHKIKESEVCESMRCFK